MAKLGLDPSLFFLTLVAFLLHYYYYYPKVCVGRCILNQYINMYLLSTYLSGPGAVLKTLENIKQV